LRVDGLRRVLSVEGWVEVGQLVEEGFLVEEEGGREQAEGARREESGC
jgi:hypothetical protein